jgi:hypothetical protein
MLLIGLEQIFYIKNSSKLKGQSSKLESNA